MSSDTSGPSLYHLTLRAPSAALHTVAGHFSGGKAQELVVSTATALDIYRPDAETGKLHKVSAQHAFSHLQNMAVLRVPGSAKDLLVLTSDAGSVTVAELSAASAKFVPVAQEPHSKSSLRRTTPGAYLCVSACHSAVMVAALQRDKLVYRVDTQGGKVALSAPLEAGARPVLTLAMCALDTGAASPQWAAVEADAAAGAREHDSAAAPLRLNYYSLDAGLNHVAHTRGVVPLPASAGLVVPLPAPVGGVLVCCDSVLVYERTAAGAAAATRVEVPLPVRAGAAGATVVCHCVHTLKSGFFVLLQTALGDLVKVTAAGTHDTGVRLRATHFDTIPVCNSLNVFRAGFLYANTTAGDKLLYQFESLGDDGQNNGGDGQKNGHKNGTSNGAARFAPAGLQHLALVDVVEALAPVTDACVVASSAAADAAPQLVALSGSALKTLTHGLPVTELVSSPLPMAPTAIYATKVSRDAASDEYLVLTCALTQRTLVLSIGEVVEEAAASGLVADQHTLAVQQAGQRSVVQVHGNGIRHVRHAAGGGAPTHTDWYPPAGVRVLQAAASREQVVVALSNREVCYFEVDAADDQLTEYRRRHEVAGGAVCAVAMGGARGRKCAFAVVACADATVAVLSLRAHDTLAEVGAQALSACCRSLVVEAAPAGATVHLGLDSGVYARAHLDGASGRLSDTRAKYLGARPVHLRAMRVPGSAAPGVLAVSTRPWAAFAGRDGVFSVVPLVGCRVASGTSFYSEAIGADSVAGFRGRDLCIFTLGDAAASGFVTAAVRLRYTGKKMARDAASGRFFVLASDAGAVSPYARDAAADADYYAAFGYARAAGSWAACLHVVDAAEGAVVHTHEFAGGAHGHAMAQFECAAQRYLVVATAAAPAAGPGAGPALHTFAVGAGAALTPVHRTPLDAPAAALCGFFGGRVVVAVGRELRTYELGKKQLLRKSATPADFLRRVTALRHLGGDLVVVADAHASLSYWRFDARANRFAAVVNDTTPRAVTAFLNVDDTTVVGGDKFGNVFVNRVPADAAARLSDHAELASDALLGGAAARFRRMCDFYVHDTPTAFATGSFVAGGTQSVVYTGLQGTVGMLVPLATKQEAAFMGRLECAMRRADTRGLTARDHAKFRGYYNPVKNVVDGDYVETYYDLDAAARAAVAAAVDRTPRDVDRKLHDLRNRAAF